ncbi:serine/threonine-protein kinase [Streptomyces sp. NPDC048604]|uniref:serine/threonine-protein kinase n=1 Tax=Streptomyces sp. NPDC048604 TaxID=3365578 RepID=UPI00371232A0
MTGERIAGYQVESEIGRGAMAVVYRAKDPRLDRDVALKVFAPGLSQSDRFRRRFAFDTRVVAAIDHPHIVPIFEAGETDDGLLYLVMRYILAPDLGTLLDRDGPLPVAAAVRIAAQAASALDAVHSHGVLHGDVKPGSILVAEGTDRDHPEFVYLKDFGLAKPLLDGSGRDREILGTPKYMAPERISEQPVDGRSDLYSLACVVYEALAGRPPFQRDDPMQLLWAHMHDLPPEVSLGRPDIPPGVDVVMAKALAKSPEDRYASCHAFVVDLRSAASSGPPGAAVPPHPEVQTPAPPPPAAGGGSITPPGPPFGDDDDEW